MGRHTCRESQGDWGIIGRLGGHGETRGRHRETGESYGDTGRLWSCRKTKGDTGTLGTGRHIHVRRETGETQGDWGVIGRHRKT